MANSLTISATLTGIKEAVERLSELKPSKMRAVFRKALDQASKVVLATAKSLVPVRSGLLRKSLGRKVKPLRDNPDGVVMFAVVGPRTGFRVEKDGRFFNPTRYAQFQEFGTKNHPPQPFLRPAWDAHKDEIPQIVARVVEEALAKLAK